MLSNKNQVPTQTAPAETQTPASEPTTPPVEAMQENVVMLTADGFSPATLTIKAGTPVTWTNKSGENATVSSDPHPTHTNYKPLNLGKFSDGESLSLTFDKPGTYAYHNHLNSSQTGTVIVE